MDFDEIANQQGWNTESLLFILREFVTKVGMQEDLDRFAQKKAEPHLKEW